MKDGGFPQKQDGEEAETKIESRSAVPMPVPEPEPEPELAPEPEPSQPTVRMGSEPPDEAPTLAQASRDADAADLDPPTPSTAVAPSDPTPTPNSSSGDISQPTGSTRSSTRVTGSTSAATSVRNTTFISASDTMRLEEIRRTRAFSMVALPTALVVLASLPFLGGDPVAKLVFALGMVIIALGAVLVRWMIRTDDGYQLTPVLIYGFACVFGAFTGVYFFGPFSPAVAVIPFGLYFFSLSQSFRATLAIYATCALIELGLAGSSMLGLVSDRGLVVAGDLSMGHQALILLLVEVVFLATFLVARAGRRAMVHALEIHDRDLRALAQREALLKEARLELERALEAGGLGRFSDQELGSFKLGKVIGRGGMGEVYEAAHLTTGAPAAMKLLHSPAMTDAGTIRRFTREAKIASKLRSAHVVQVLEVGGSESAVPFIAMELLRGQDLADLLRQKRRLSLRRVASLARQVGVGLAAARAEGIVHRDLKPRNLFLAESAGKSRLAWKILDFGVSKLMDTQGTLTQDHLVGTPSYMAPEQAAGGEVDHRTDLYALGVICYRALTGRPAFPGDGIAEILYKVLHTMPPRPSEHSRVPEDVDLVLAIAMAKKPAHRFETAEQLAEALHHAEQDDLPEHIRQRGLLAQSLNPWGETR